MTFDELTPDSMLPVIEDSSGLLFTGYTAPFSSYINRVYELRTNDGVKVVVKFYRPQRWSREAILDEHKFMLDCQENEIAVVTPMLLKDQSTIGTFNGLYFALFPKKAGRQLEINNFEDWVRLGSLIARIHSVGAAAGADSRIVIDPRITTLSDCTHLCNNVVPGNYRETYRSLCMKLIDLAAPSFEKTEKIRIHGDLHTGNILNRMDEGLLVIDFDDMAMGPPVQDLWLLLPERVEKAEVELDLFLEGYEQFRPFDRKSLGCIEYLRAMRMIYFLSWCSRQMSDYQFKKNFPEWGSDAFWQREIADLSDQIDCCGEAKSVGFNC